MDGATRLDFGVRTPMTASSTVLSGHGDFNGDGRSDLLFRGPNGEVRSWLIDGANLTAQGTYNPVPLDWSIVDAHGDYNGDGKSDILWRHTDGTVSTWLMDRGYPARLRRAPGDAVELDASRR